LEERLKGEIDLVATEVGRLRGTVRKLTEVVEEVNKKVNEALEKVEAVRSPEQAQFPWPKFEGLTAPTPVPCAQETPDAHSDTESDPTRG
jgi:hypothetical protein